MRRRRQIVIVLCGLAFVAIGTIVGLSGSGGSDGTGGLVVLLALVALGLSLWKVRGSLDTTADAPAVPWAADEPLRIRPPSEPTATPPSRVTRWPA
ncbi:hypothetical protein [Natrinema sp. SYSU A 869]|uniref:hypothetical protein n=1 Tax=Natrinema sp. SYSU A 869 TaxID=2871694 RepID=UPI002102DFAF|nr:hypothetical protein [Natrinema sp. SYSU A 869]